MLENLLFTTVDIETQSVAKSGTGGTAITYVSFLANVPCKIDALSADAIQAYGRLGYTATDKVYFNTDVSLTIADRLIVDNTTAFLVRSYEHFKAGSIEFWQAVVMRAAL